MKCLSTMSKYVLILSINLACDPANAVVITFDSLTGLNADPYPGSVEDGFAIIPITGDWREAHSNGNPVPSIFGRSEVGVVEVTETTVGAFTFTSVELDHASPSGPGTYSVEGFLNNVLVLMTSGTMPLSFGTIASPNASQRLDTLRITMNMGNATYNIDNLDVTPVPEPSTLAIGGLALAALAVRRRRKQIG